MGHRTLAMTMRYAHLSPAHKLDAVRRLQREPTGTTTGTDPAPPTEAREGAPGTSARVVGGNPKWRRAGSNGRPRDYETLALAN